MKKKEFKITSFRKWGPAEFIFIFCVFFFLHNSFFNLRDIRNFVSLIFFRSRGVFRLFRAWIVSDGPCIERRYWGIESQVKFPAIKV